MTDETRSKSLGQDLLGISLFAVAVFFGVSAVMSMLHGGAGDGANVSTSMMGSLVALVGTVPSLWIAAGLAFLGARQWVVGPSAATLRHVIGIAGVAFGLAVFCGALSLPTAGAFGAAVGGSLAQTLSTVVGVLIGLVLIAAPAWWAWIGPAGWMAGVSFAKSSKVDGLHAALPSEETEGVSAAEAEALLPERRISPAEADELAQALAEAETSVPPVQLPPLYPPDVRREGKIPPGAVPLDPPDARKSKTHTSESAGASGGAAASPRGDQAVSGGAPLGAPGGGESAGEDLAGGATPPSTLDLRKRERPQPLAGLGSAAPAADPPAPVVPEPDVPKGLVGVTPPAPVGEIPEPVSAPAPAPEPPPVVEPAPAPLAVEPEPEPEPEPESEPVEPVAVVEPPAATPIDDAPSGEPFVERMRPSWEQPDLFDSDEGFVDIQPVETLVPDLPAAEAASAADDEEEDPEDEEELLAQGDDEADEDEYEEDEEEEEPDEVYAEGEDDEEGDEEEEYEDEEEDEEVYAEGEEEEDDEDEEEYEDEEEPEEAFAEDEEDEDEEYEDEEAEEPDEVHAEDESEEDDDEEADESDEEAAEQREVVLEPQAAPEAPAEAEAEADEAEEILDADLVYRAGCLFLERDRVAVSLLQREFNLDFNGATRVLDRLQTLGLIGPYLGGKKRDILMTPEAWRERVEVV